MSMYCVSFVSLCVCDCVMQQIAEGRGEWVVPAHEQMAGERGF